MTKYIIDDEKAGPTITLYETKEQWDADQYSRAGYEREYAAHNYRTGKRSYSGPIERYSAEPYRFPCLAITDGMTTYQSNGPDEISITFFYDFEVIE